MYLKILQSFEKRGKKKKKTVDALPPGVNWWNCWLSLPHSCRTILVLSCELLALWVPRRVVCIFIVYLCIHALSISYHLNWLMCHYFLCGRLIAAVAAPVRAIYPERASFSQIGFNFKKGGEITSFLSLTVVQNLVQSQNTKTFRCSSKSPDNGGKFFISNTESFYLFRVGGGRENGRPCARGVYLSSCGPAISHSLTIRNTLNLESQHFFRFK